MSFITVKSVYRDTGNFLRNLFTTFFLIAFLCTFITVILSHMLLPSKAQIVSLMRASYPLSNIDFLELVLNMTQEQKHTLLRSLAVAAFSGITGNVILTGSVLLITQQISTGQCNSSSTLSAGILMMLPRLFILIFLITLLVLIGIILLVIPGVLLAIMLSFAPVILVLDKMSIFTAILVSIKLTCKNIRLVAPAVIIWLLSKALLFLFIPNITILIPNIIYIIANILSNLISTILLVYLFRLHMLIFQ